MEGIHAGFLRSEQRFSQRPALEVGRETLTYDALGRRARALAAAVDRAAPPGPPITAVFAYRTATAFVGILGTLLGGRGYVALNRRFPSERTRLMLLASRARVVIADRESAEQLVEVLAEMPEPLLLVLPDVDDASEFGQRFPDHTIVSAADLSDAEDWEPPPVDPEAIAYLIFTSGSTGTPKAVMVPHRTVRRYVEIAADLWEVTEADRCSQMYELTFDASVSDIFVAWERGACVCCPSLQQLLMPQKFLLSAEITFFDAVPSTGVIMKQLGLLKPGAYPSLRLVLSSGEALPVELAAAWAEAAPNASFENVYGPTEVTVGCSAYRWDHERSPRQSEHGVVPIGWFHPGTQAVVLDGDGNEVAEGEEGELYLAGDQLALGYWDDPERTAAAFVVPPGREELHYRTGDRVRRPVGDGPMTYLGRVDFQVKIAGHRVELGEVEAFLREAAEVDEAVAVGWPPDETGETGIVGFVAATGPVDVEAVRGRMLQRVPEYLVPRDVRVLPAMPLNANGKVDRGALIRHLEEASAP